jgi:Holliday junction DNA helicase RuvA
MYAYIKGIVEYKAAEYLVIENQGIGYKIITSLSTLDKVEIGKEVKIFTYLHVREDIFAMYGFLTPEELRVFELLISVSGIGPKVANSILSSLSPSKFSLSVITADVGALKSVSGVGLKTAQRIILELKDKLKNEQAIEPSVSNILDDSVGNMSEAMSALQVLGYSSNEAARALKGIDADLNLEETIRRALKNMNK